ncbi:MAG TPA: NADH-dependent alcohol dehydrogenase, partial [Syntrophaceae bacterium]|nr:NADH-dependent alcohol dehydrogenase [Syntrophaceae bacterium]
MLDFTFHNPTKILFGKDATGRIAGEIPRRARVMVTYGAASAKKYGVLDEVLAALSGFDITPFGGIEPNPEYETLIKGAALAREKKIDFLLAIGGGSVIDGTKFMAAAIP